MDRYSFWQELACILNTSFNRRLKAEPKKHIKPSHSDFSPILFAVPSFLCLCQPPDYRGREVSIQPPKSYLLGLKNPSTIGRKNLGEENNITVTLKTVFYSVAEESTPISNYSLFLLPAMWLVLDFNIQMHLLPEKINCQL